MTLASALWGFVLAAGAGFAAGVIAIFVVAWLHDKIRN